MSTEGRLAELQRKHAALEAKLADAEKGASTDSVQIAALKRDKLRLKEEITKLGG